MGRRRGRMRKKPIYHNDMKRKGNEWEKREEERKHAEKIKKVK